MRILLLVVAVGCGGTPPKPDPVPTNVQKTEPPIAPKPTGLEKTVCGQRPEQFGPITLNADQVPLRRGATVAKYGDIATSKEEPIEVCSPSGQAKWLQTVSCNDGSPGKGINRKGNVGKGGLCGSIIDLYVTTCPEKTYEVYMDMYMCGPGENFME
jgi:hypothetical protein